MNIITTFISYSNLKPEKEEVQDKPGLSENKVTDTKSFRNCHVSTSLSDLVPCQLVDSRTGKKREACVAFLQFNLGPQKQDSDQRITSMNIEVSVEEVHSKGSKASTKKNPDSSTPSPELEVKCLLPTRARSEPSYVEVTTSQGIGVDPNFNGISVANIKADVEKQYRIPNTMSMESLPAGQMGAIWQLYENEAHKSGVPPVVNVALVLQTDGVPFEIEVRFTGHCPLFGTFSVKGKVVMRIGRDLLWMRTPKKDAEVLGLDDIDSEAFREWVKTKTQNNWAEQIEYEP